jgi:DNA recombination protein RmuC
MELLIIALVVLNLVAVAFLYWRSQQKNDGQGLLHLQSQLQDLQRAMEQKMGESAREMNTSMKSQLSESTKIVREVTEGLAKLGETNRQVVGFAEQLQRLQDTLTNPKQRGVLGEYYLEAVLQNVLAPNQYKMQYAFKNGEIADAVVFVKDKIIPIDSKFPLENYSRYIDAKDEETRAKYERAFINDLKLRIQETAKYIRPAEETMDFAFMVIPSESIYYDLLTNKIGGSEDSILQRAAGSYHVIIVSPTSFLAYLQTVLQGLKALQIEESAKEIIKRVEDLGRHISKYDDYHKKLGGSLSTTVNHFNASRKELGKIDKDVFRITEHAPGIEPMAIDKPAEE